MKLYQSDEVKPCCSNKPRNFSGLTHNYFSLIPSSLVPPFGFTVSTPGFPSHRDRGLRSGEPTPAFKCFEPEMTLVTCAPSPLVRIRTWRGPTAKRLGNSGGTREYLASCRCLGHDGELRLGETVIIIRQSNFSLSLAHFYQETE